MDKRGGCESRRSIETSDAELSSGKKDTEKDQTGIKSSNAVNKNIKRILVTSYDRLNEAREVIRWRFGGFSTLILDNRTLSQRSQKGRRSG